MPLKLIPPREGKTTCYYIRGSHLGYHVYRSTRVSDRATAQKALVSLRRQIERGEFEERKERGPTFASAAITYLKEGGDDRFLDPILEHFGEAALSEIDQDAIAEAAEALYPAAAPSTRNRQVYTPISAVLKWAGVEKPIKRPKGSGGEARVRWLWPEEAERLFMEAAAVDRELACLLVLLVYTGLRISEALSLLIRDMALDEGFVYLPHSKNEQPRGVHLTPFVIATLRAHPRGLDREGRIFRFTKGSHLYKLVRKAATAAGVPWFTPHVACHTYATWMRRYGGLDTRGLVGTGRWKDPKSVHRYEHVVTSEEARKADALPVPKARKV